MVQVDERFNGRQVELRVGDTLQISLSENASTGFQWTIPAESAQKLEKVLHEHTSSVEGAGGPPGKPGVRHFQFEAFAPGTVELELQYRRPWETGPPAGRSFNLQVSVRPAS
jgi:inhibitor of cysteine peptidase